MRKQRYLNLPTLEDIIKVRQLYFIKNYTSELEQVLVQSFLPQPDSDNYDLEIARYYRTTLNLFLLTRTPFDYLIRSSLMCLRDLPLLPEEKEKKLYSTERSIIKLENKVKRFLDDLKRDMKFPNAISSRESKRNWYSRLSQMKIPANIRYSLKLVLDCFFSLEIIFNAYDNSFQGISK